MQIDLPAKVSSLPVGQSRRFGEVHSESHCNAVAVSLEQDPAELLALEHQVVRPFKHQRLRGHRDVYRFDERQPRGYRQALRGRIAGGELDEGASEEIAGRGDPMAALPALSRLLVERDQPVALAEGLIGYRVGIGRAGALDDPDAAQKSAPAALSVIAPNGPISR